MNLGEFHSSVSAEINRGAAHDAAIPDAVRRAARWLERNYTFRYMEIKTLISYSAGIDYVDAFLIDKTKKIMDLAINDTDGTVDHLDQVEPIDLHEKETAKPTSWYLLQTSTYIWTNTVIDQAYTGYVHRAQYTTWPTSLATSGIWLIDNAEDVLLAQAMILLAPRMRAPELAALYGKMRDEGLRTLVMADEEQRSSGAVLQMNFGLDV